MPGALVNLPDLGHRLPWEEKKPAVLRFLERVTRAADADEGAAERSEPQNPGPKPLL
jgi:hypothetical protein